MKIWIYLIFITFLPGIELRGSIPLAILYYKENVLLSFTIITVANILLTPIAFLMWHYILVLAEKIPIVKKYLERYLANVQRRSKRFIDKYGFLGLMLFVAIPLPGTGAYTGAFVAEIFEMNKKKAFIAIAMGVVIAGIIVTLASAGIISIRLIGK